MTRKVKVEFFTAESPCHGCMELLRLADEIAKECKGKVEVIKHIGPCKEFEKYGLTLVPAVVFEEGKMIISSVCPDKETLILSLRELGVR